MEKWEKLKQEVNHIRFAREKLNKKFNTESSFVLKDFRHPVSGHHYIVSYIDGWMYMERKNKTHEKKRDTVDSFLYFWLEDENYDKILNSRGGNKND